MSSREVQDARLQIGGSDGKEKSEGALQGILGDHANP